MSFFEECHPFDLRPKGCHPSQNWHEMSGSLKSEGFGDGLFRIQDTIHEIRDTNMEVPDPFSFLRPYFSPSATDTAHGTAVFALVIDGLNLGAGQLTLVDTDFIEEAVEIAQTIFLPADLNSGSGA